MTTTLIVRDATLAINGAPEKRGEPREHLLSRVAEVTRMEGRTAEECVEVLSSVAGGEGADPDVLEALLIVALAKPDVAKRMNLPTLATGRRLAAKLERAAEFGHTLAILELLCQHFPGEEGLERELANHMRRQGTVHDLVKRYYDRAQKLLREGRHGEAAGWLREVLQLDPTRRDAARQLRDLRFKRTKRKKASSGTLRFLLVFGLISLGITWGVLREVRLRQEFDALPQSVPGNTATLRRRLNELQEFADRNPVWHGAFQILTERSTLRVQLEVLEEQERQVRAAAELVTRERLEAAELCRKRGLSQIQSSDLQRALDSFREALEHGGADWSQRASVLQDVAELEAALSEQP
jgi:tetratricopeptide (TPR) repeat protein